MLKKISIITVALFLISFPANSVFGKPPVNDNPQRCKDRDDFDTAPATANNIENNEKQLAQNGNQQPEFAPGELLIRLKDIKDTKLLLEKIKELNGEAKLLAPKIFKNTLYQVKFKDCPNEKLIEIKKQFEEYEWVKYVEFNSIMKIN